VCHGGSYFGFPVIFARGTPHRPPRVDHHKQPLRVFTLGCGVAMRGQNPTGEPDQVVTVMRNIGDYGAGLS
jgi:hypothetical protein